MSTLAVGTIKSNSSVAPAIQNTSGTVVGHFINKFVNFNGEATGTILSSNGISSVTDLGTGYYRINFSASFSDTNYAYALGAMNRFSSSSTSGPTSDKNEGGDLRLKHDQKAAGTVEIQSWRHTNTVGEEANDTPEICALFIGS
tara:strand:- start:13 stop:444 length:432 start_codon:yes stop_codon:yes gene_type:complete